MRKKEISTLKVAATYIGTVVGAGFATGQEVLQFFTRFGILGLGGLIITTILFIVFGYLIMDLGKDLKARSHLEIIRYSGGKILGTFIDWIITIFLFGTLAVMIAGTGALFEQQLKLPAILGNLVMAVFTAITVLTGINGVINSISSVVPFLLAAVLGTSIFSVLRYPAKLHAIPALNNPSAIVNHWLFAALLYVSYNTVISIAVLGPLGAQAKNRKTLFQGAVFGGLGLGFASALIYIALSGHLSEIEKLEVPMIHIAGGISPVAQILYAIVLIAEIYTTAVGALYGFTSRIAEIQNTPGKDVFVVAGTTVGALLASRFGFSNMVKYLYPLIGYCGVIILIAVVVSVFSRKNPIDKKIKSSY